jgi:hypothetical protein
MEQIKEAFYKVKQDIDSLKKEVSLLNSKLIETRESLIEVCGVLKNLSKKIEESKREIKKEIKEEIIKETPRTPLTSTPISSVYTSQSPANYYPVTFPPFSFQTPVPQTPTNSSSNTTDRQHSSISNTPQNVQKAQNYAFSTGNEGVPTDRQTNQQTDQHIVKSSYNQEFFPQIEIKNPPSEIKENPINNAAQILDSLDNLKKEIRLKFKRLTDQEFLVFSTIYQSSEETGYTDYKNLSERLNLTESSIRDYIGRLIKKGIPLDKIKINNKTVHISISQNLKKVATLPTILQLRAI